MNILVPLASALPPEETLTRNVLTLTYLGFGAGLVIFVAGYFVFLKWQKSSRDLGDKEAEVGEKLETLPGKSRKK